MQKVIFTLLLLIAAVSTSMAAETDVESEDIYLEGYIRAMLKERYSLGIDVEVRNGEVFMKDSVADTPRYEELIEDVSKVKGVESIKIVDEEQMKRVERTWIMPGAPLFKPLTADPRWPEFAGSYRYYTNSEHDKHAFAASIGKTFSLWRTNLANSNSNEVNNKRRDSIFAEIGLQMAAFPTFDLDNADFDLINADYQIGIPVTIQFTGVTVMGRISHQSTYIGDEYMEKNPDIERINLSYETIDLLASYEPNEWFRIYAGGGYVIHADPTDYGAWLYQGGVELRVIADYTGVPDLLIAIDAKGLEETYYTPSVTVSVGLELTERMKIALEVHDGYSPDGQFYNEKVTWMGIGIHLY
ncbi:MAG: DUF1207 domain-containing protein [Deferribacteraceae bacterium]|jgi:hypothetical protein|nr:DUF1207 domain-containing protein [Deferribacteraceae bacterium]